MHYRCNNKHVATMTMFNVNVEMVNIATFNLICINIEYNETVHIISIMNVLTMDVRNNPMNMHMITAKIDINEAMHFKSTMNVL